MISRYLLFVLLMLTNAFWCFGHNDEHHDEEQPRIKFTENKGQWDDHILYRAGVSNGALFLEPQKLTWSFRHPEDISRIHDIHHGKVANPTEADMLVRGHAFQTTFLGSSTEAMSHGESPTSDYANYYLTNDRSRWASGVRHFRQVHYEALYPNIDLLVYSMGPDVKYDFVVKPGGDMQQILMQYEGADELFLKEGRLHIKTSINEIVEQQPYAYQLINGVKREVGCEFVLENDIVHFNLTTAYREDLELVIDPRLVFSSYTGSSVDNWGFTATFDSDEFLYAGGISFGTGYPISSGAFIASFQGGQSGALNLNPFDISISKFSPDGVSLIYSTYLGGSGNEAPHSLVVTDNNELIVFGTTSSDDFPLGTNPYESNFSGGTDARPIRLLYRTGSDLFLTKFNTSGQALLGGTYIGGSENDGLNQGALGGFSYGDIFRGEVITNDANEIFVATCTSSDDFPTAGNPFQPNYGGGSLDGVIFKFNSNLSNLEWSSFYGGQGQDAVFAMQPNSLGDLYITGGTTSDDLQGTANGLVPNYQDNIDGFVAEISGNGQQLLANTYIGTPEYDQTFFVQVDEFDDVYLLGQTEDTYPVTPGLYSNPNSGQFIHKINGDLNQTIWSTVVGTGSGFVDLTLTAFLVTDCGQIFISGWGGETNFGRNNQSTTNNLPITQDAYQGNTDGSDFYLMVLDTNASGLVYGSFFGSPSASEHCDGGTSRFDKNGTAYQAVCSGCGGFSDFPTTPNAWSRTNNSDNCNLSAFKFDISDLTARIGFNVPSVVCLPSSPIQFENLSTGGAEFTWIFGDGATSSQFQPTHSYTQAGVYEVLLIVSDSSSFCNSVDTTSKVITVDFPPVAVIEPLDPICEGDTILLDASASIPGNLTWSPLGEIDDPDSLVTLAWPSDTTLFKLVIQNSCGSDSAEVFVPVTQNNSGIMNDTANCGPVVLELEAWGGDYYQWSPAELLLDGAPGQGTFADITETTTFTVAISDGGDCIWDQEVTVYINFFPPDINVSPDTVICRGDTATLKADGGVWVEWSGPGVPDGYSENALVVNPEGSAQYLARVENGCGSSTAFTRVSINPYRVQPFNDTAVCPNTEFTLRPGYAESYTWKPAFAIVEDSKEDAPVFSIETPTNIKLIGTDSLGCVDSTWTRINILPKPLLDLGEDIIIDFGDVVNLQALADSGFLEWQIDPTLSCFKGCRNPIASPLESTTYYAKLLQTTGCFNIDSVRVRVEGAFYAPNAFTPDNDGKNDRFYVFGVELQDFQLRIYNRWGQVIYDSNDIYEGWDGTFKGKPSQIETYVWRVDYANLKGQNFFKTGRVTLIR